MMDYAVLPEGYKEIKKVDLQKDKKLAGVVNGLAFIVMAAMIVPMLFIVPIKELMSDGKLMYLAKLGAMAVGIMVYIILHELVHGIFMIGYSKIKPTYGFSGMYAYAGSSAFFCKTHYIVIALAPIVIWGVVLLILNLLVPVGWFWVVYLIQIMNISGAAGDLYVSVSFSKLPKDILINDTGVSMTIYSREEL